MGDKSVSFSEGLCHEFWVTARRAQWSPRHVDWLSKNVEICRLIRQLADGTAEIEPRLSHTLSTGDWQALGPQHAQRIISENTLEGRIRVELVSDGKELRVNGKKVVLVQMPPSETFDDRLVALKKSGRLFLEDALCNYLSEHRGMIPTSWRETLEADEGAMIGFLGSCYLEHGEPYVEYEALFFLEGEWGRRTICNDIHFRANIFVAVVED